MKHKKLLSRASCEIPPPGKIDDFETVCQDCVSGPLSADEGILRRVNEAGGRQSGTKGRFYRGGEFCNWLASFLFLISVSAVYARPTFEEPWGTDSELSYKTKYESTSSPSIGAKVIDRIVWFHQNIISPVDGPRSHFRPSSSEYMRQAIHQHGFFMGYLMGCDRLMRENDDPWVYPVIGIEGTHFKWDPP